MGPPLRELLLRAPGAGRLDGPGVRSGRAHHPVCGDQVEVFVRVVDGIVAEATWLATACPATTAVAALAVTTWRDQPVGDCARRLAAAVQAAGGLAAHERHAERLLVAAFTAATVVT